MIPSVRASARRLVPAVIALSTIAAAARAQDSVAAAPADAPLARTLAALIEHERAAKGIPAISIALVRGQHTVWSTGIGWADSASGQRATASTVYRVGSVSKLFTDLAVMQLVARGELSLDAPVQRYLPGFHPANGFSGPITIRELSSHRSGLTREPPVGNYFDDHAPSLAATVASLDRTSLVYAPGTHVKYSNAGVAVLGYVLERTQHQPFERYLKRSVLEPMGLDHSAFAPTPEVAAKVAKGTMWTLDGRRFAAPTFQLGMAPAGSMYSTVLDLGRFLETLFAGGVAPNGTRILPRDMLDSMWTPQFVAPGTASGYGIGFSVSTLDGHRTIGHDGAIYGFSTSLLAMPDDSIGAVVVASLDVANGVTDHIAQTALRLMLDRSAGRPLAALDTTSAFPPGVGRVLVGAYSNSMKTVEIEEYEDHVYLTSSRGGVRNELRIAAAPLAGLLVDDPFAYGPLVRVPRNGTLLIGSDTLAGVPAPDALDVIMVRPKPPPSPSDSSSLIGEYGPDHDVLYVREKDGKLNALIEWFFDYPLTRVSRDVYAFPPYGLYDGEQLVVHRGPDGRVAGVSVGAVRFERRPLPADDDRTNARITPVRSPRELRRIALAARPPAEPPGLRASDLVELRSLDTTIRYDIRYATSNNFMGTPFYTSAHAFMQRPAAEAVVRAAAKLRAFGFGLIIHDAYRPWYVTKMFWDGTPPDKHVFVADPSQGSRHNRGCAVDLTLYDLHTGAPIRMTGGYDEFSDRSYPLYPGGTSRQRWHRDLLRHVMEAQGFTVYDAEWWHFDYKDWRSYPIGNLTFEQLAASTRTERR
jgi:CubicO group peptidase (beta-lactamase class C family)/D-alanyl-D-alanine dipeptidase